MDDSPMSDPHVEERVGPNYDRAKMLEARRHTWRAIEKIAAGIRPGMRESEGVEFANAVLKDLGLLRGWHGVYLRFGVNTVLTYWDKEAPDLVLRDNDIFYIDIGPVWEKWEGDGGNTFVVGDDPEMQHARIAVRQVFDRVHEKWRTDSMTGAALYDYASKIARSMGWELVPLVAGHRLGDFPHKALHSGTLAAAAFTPATDLWVLEIQIRHLTLPFGAFYEDLLLESGGEHEHAP
jgi:methionyl aminopeptidase